MEKRQYFFEMGHTEESTQLWIKQLTELRDKFADLTLSSEEDKARKGWIQKLDQAIMQCQINHHAAREKDTDLDILELKQNAQSTLDYYKSKKPKSAAATA